MGNGHRSKEMHRLLELRFDLQSRAFPPSGGILVQGLDFGDRKVSPGEQAYSAGTMQPLQGGQMRGRLPHRGHSEAGGWHRLG